MESRINTNEVNFIHPSIAKKDIELFGFEDAQNVFHIENCWTLAHIMHVAGIFSSISEARKNGWNKPIPNGFSEFTVGKTKKKIWILNKTVIDKPRSDEEEEYFHKYVVGDWEE